MTEVFNADEVFEMAEEIEKNGAAFYKKAATIIEAKSTKKLLEELSKWELSHREIFATMRDELKKEDAEPLVFDPEGEAAMYLKAMADGHVFDVTVNVDKFFKNTTTVTEVLKTALKMEKDSIIFYLGIKDAVASATGKEKIGDIIKEEMRHIAFLNNELVSM